MKLLACLLLLGLAALPACAGAYGLNITATGDDFLFVSSNGGSYYGGANWDNWHKSDLIHFDLAPGEEHSLLFHVHDHWGPNGDENPGGFLAQLDIADGSGLMWTNGSTRLLSDLGDWQYALSDPLAGPVAWSSVASGWQSSRPATSGPQSNGSSIWNHTNAGPIEGIVPDALWIWSPENFTPAAPVDLWFRLNANAVPTPEPSAVAMLGLGLLALLPLRRRP